MAMSPVSPNAMLLLMSVRCAKIMGVQSTATTFLGSSAVEQLTVNQRVAGSNPVPGAKPPSQPSCRT